MSNFVQYIKPLYLVGFSLLLWILLFFSAPLEININVNSIAILYIIINIIFFTLGTLLVRKRKYKTISIINYHKLRTLFNLILLVGALGLSLKLFDRLLIRGISWERGFIDNRDAMNGSSGGILAFLAALLSPVGLIPLFLYMKYKLKVSYLIKILCYILFWSYALDAILLGNRSSIFIVIFLYASYFSYVQNISITLRRLMKYIFISASFLGFFGYMFFERSSELFGDGVDIYQVVMDESAYNFTIKPTKEFRNNFDNYNAVQKAVAFTYINTVQYITHGVFEFSFLYDNFKANHSLGAKTFWVYNRFVHLILLQNYSVEEVENLSVRVGVYETFFGSLFIDFGWFSILFMFCFGLIVKRVFLKAEQEDDASLLIYFYLALVILFFPFFNFIDGAGGIFILNAFILFTFIKYFMNKIAVNKH